MAMKVMGNMKKYCFCLLLALVGPSAVHAQFIDTEWQVSGFTGEARFINPESVMLKTQSFSKGWAEGVFFQCPFAGLSKTYTTYAVDEFLANREFVLFKPAENDLRASGQKIFVHRISCEGRGDPSVRKVLYPFVTTENIHTAYYLFENGYFTLSNTE
jgi:hypothetical protein